MEKSIINNNYIILAEWYEKGIIQFSLFSKSGSEKHFLYPSLRTALISLDIDITNSIDVDTPPEMRFVEKNECRHYFLTLDELKNKLYSEKRQEIFDQHFPNNRS